MIKVVDRDVSDKEKVIEILKQQNYSYDYVVDYIISWITDDPDKYPGINIANEESTYTNIIEEFAESYIVDVFLPVIEDEENADYDFIDILSDLISEDEEGYIQDFESQFESLVDEKNKEYQDEIDELNKLYWDTRL